MGCSTETASPRESTALSARHSAGGNVSSWSGGNVGANGSYGAGGNIVPRSDEANDASIGSPDQPESIEEPSMPDAQYLPPLREPRKFPRSSWLCFVRDDYD